MGGCGSGTLLPTCSANICAGMENLILCIKEEFITLFCFNATFVNTLANGDFDFTENSSVELNLRPITRHGAFDRIKY